MRRISLVVNRELLEEAKGVFGVKTYSAAVNCALAEAIRAGKVQHLSAFFGRGLWEGDLPKMREDAPPGRRHRGGRKNGAG
jgi:hypothetical protein